MGFENDLRHALQATAARARTDVEKAKREGDPQRVAEAEIALLRAQLDTLTRIVVELAAMKVDGGGTPTSIGKRILKLAAPVIDFDASDDEDVEDPEVAQSAYRGAVAGSGAKMCARCGTMLDEDEPEMTQAMGRVCTSCFARGE
jgi:hypothetical protein